jgi:hypothetical protein
MIRGLRARVVGRQRGAGIPSHRCQRGNRPGAGVQVVQPQGAPPGHLPLACYKTNSPTRRDNYFRTLSYVATKHGVLLACYSRGKTRSIAGHCDTTGRRSTPLTTALGAVFQAGHAGSIPVARFTAYSGGRASVSCHMISGSSGSYPSRGHAGRTELTDRFFDAQVSAGDADREWTMVRTDLAVPNRCHGSGRVDTRVTESRGD